MGSIKMRYSTEPRFRKYIKGYGFLSFARKFGDKYGKKLIDTATKTGIDAAKTASKRIVHIKIEFQKIVNFLNTNSDDNILSRFTNKRWVEIYDQSGGNYNVNKEIRIKIPTLRSDLCDYSDVYIIVKGDITLEGGNDANKQYKNLAF